jgi:hypothetical protein
MNRIHFAAPWSVLLLGVALNLGCGDRSQSYRSPTAPILVATPAPVLIWRGGQTSLYVSGPCAGQTVGWTRMDIEWSVDIHGDDFKLIEDPINDYIVYTGTLEGDAFSAAYHQPEYAQPCQFRESSIKGSFSADRRAFDAEEVWIFGAPGSEETRVVSRWHVTTIP